MGILYSDKVLYLGFTVFCLLLFIQIGQAGWSPWTRWSPCSVTCGNGIQSRRRHCTEEPEKKGICVYQNQTEEYQCYAGQMCKPINGGWSAWGPYSNCSRRCGKGFMERWRKCDNPKPQYGGKVCAGATQDVGVCEMNPCPPLYSGDTQTECSIGRVHCADGIQCISEFRRCDFWRDCRDGSDESACREGEPIQILYNNNSGIGVRINCIAFPLLSSGVSLWFSANRR